MSLSPYAAIGKRNSSGPADAMLHTYHECFHWARRRNGIVQFPFDYSTYVLGPPLYYTIIAFIKMPYVYRHIEMPLDECKTFCRFWTISEL